MREIRMALLEADVNLGVARDFVARVSARCVGEEVLESVTPGQQVAKRVHDELVNLLRSADRRPVIDWNTRPAPVMLIGLHGSGKTTTAAKLAAHWKRERRGVLLAAADLRRPAAADQLRVLAGQVGVDWLAPEPGESLTGFGARSLEAGRLRGHDLVIFDTGGRLHLDAELVAELKRLREAAQCRTVLLVVDAAIGQESVAVAETFHRELGLAGLILTKLDGDARGGAALSIQSVTGCPILFTGTGERSGDLEAFHPERLASRILGMGDIVTLVEKAQEAVDARQAAEMERRLLGGSGLTLEDFLQQISQMKRLGPLEHLLDLLPLGGSLRAQVPESAGADLAAFTRKAEAIIRSMTPQERRRPELLNASRRRRIARGSGTTVQDVNDLMRQFEQGRRMARQMGRLQKRLRVRA
jgi:signal recognition particle subunit SRP54